MSRQTKKNFIYYLQLYCTGTWFRENSAKAKTKLNGAFLCAQIWRYMFTFPYFIFLFYSHKATADADDYNRFLVPSDINT